MITTFFSNKTAGKRCHVRQDKTVNMPLNTVFTGHQSRVVIVNKIIYNLKLTFGKIVSVVRWFPLATIKAM